MIQKGYEIHVIQGNKRHLLGTCRFASKIPALISEYTGTLKFLEMINLPGSYITIKSKGSYQDDDYRDINDLATKTVAQMIETKKRKRK